MPSYWLKIEVKIEVEIIISNSKNHAITKHDKSQKMIIKLELKRSISVEAPTRPSILSSQHLVSLGYCIRI